MSKQKLLHMLKLESTLNDKFLALVATGEGNLEVSLAGVHSGGLVGDDEVLDV